MFIASTSSNLKPNHLTYKKRPNWARKVRNINISIMSISTMYMSTMSMNERGCVTKILTLSSNRLHCTGSVLALLEPLLAPLEPLLAPPPLVHLLGHHNHTTTTYVTMTISTISTARLFIVMDRRTQLHILAWPLDCCWSHSEYIQL